MRLSFVFFSLLLLCCSYYASGQDTVSVKKNTDSVIVLNSNGLKVSADSIVPTSKIKIKKFEPNPKRAGLYAALIPGLGQCYNRQYWKAPIVYAIMGTTMYMVIKNENEYRKYRKAYVSRLSDGDKSMDEFQGILSTTGIKQYQDEAKQNRDMMIVFTVVGYAGQILEAISGAHLRNFDISPDLSMNIRPVLTPINTLGIGLVVNFKK